MDENLFKLIEEANATVEKYRSLGIPKSEPVGRFVARLAEEAGMYPVPNLAVEICLQAYLDSKKEQLEKEWEGDKDKHRENAERLPRLAYAASLPKLSNADCVRDFIACVVHGMAVGAIPSSEGTRLLYGAQVAHSALPGGKKRRKKYTKSTPKTPSVSAASEAPSIA